MELYDYQKRVARHLRKGKSVILQAPTGAGKTIAALWPFLEMWDRDEPTAFPRQCVYSVPMRVLANQFVCETGRLIEEEMLLAELPRLTLQTGERPGDREFDRGDLIFTTIDQTLSSVLGVPYAVGPRRANLNAGAVIGAYLVFDEFHLFPPDGAFKVTLQMLRRLRHVTPFVLMTATFSTTMLEELQSLLAAEVVTLTADDLVHIPSQHGKVRRFHLIGRELGPEPILHQHRERSLAICNTVDRAQALYEGLVAAGCRPVPVADPCLHDLYAAMATAHNVVEQETVVERMLERLRALMVDQPGWDSSRWVLLLHSRFVSEHRLLREAFVRQEFGSPHKVRWQVPSLIAVSTQVIEVGLDITCQSLHSEVAPANALFQRAGRCARFAHERGDVYLYDVPPNRRGEPSYAPYPSSLGQTTRDVFAKLDGMALDFSGEQKVIEAVHAEADRQLLADMQAEERQIWERMIRAMGLGDVSVRADLIRRIDSRTLLVHDEPESLGNPFLCRGFSMWQGTLYSKFDALWERADDLGLDWVLKRPIEDKYALDDARDPERFGWRSVSVKEQLGTSTLFVVHPALVMYDAEEGFRFVASDGGAYRTPPSPDDTAKGRFDYVYHLESYLQHVKAMLLIYQRDLRDRLAWAAARLECLLGWPIGSVDQAIRLAIALHDVGKLQARWQQWARAYQQGIGEPLADPAFMAAHTHSETSEHRIIAKQVRPSRPPHGGEGAVAVARLVHQAVGGTEGLRRGVLTAIARHHTPQLSTFDDQYRLDPKAGTAIAQALQAAGFTESESLASLAYADAPSTSLEQQLLLLPPDGDVRWWVVYFLVVRAVRLADGRSQES